MARSRVRTVLTSLAVVIVVIAAAFGALMYTAFGDLNPIVDGQVVAPGVSVLKDGFVQVGFFDLGAGEYGLVDCGNDKEAKAVLAELERRHATPDAVRAILLTHGHPDHTNGCARFGKATIYAPAVEEPLIAGLAHAKGSLTSLMPAHATGLGVGHAIHDRETLELGTQHVQVFFVPGHTSGSTAYLVGGALFTGDALGITKAHTLKQSPRFTSDDPDQNQASVRALGHALSAAQTPVSVLVPAHSGALPSTTIPAMLEALP
jgi:glyoxylase-like metal-dependent hydrolase (beta-lactamase superfamily II)